MANADLVNCLDCNDSVISDWGSAASMFVAPSETSELNIDSNADGVLFEFSLIQVQFVGSPAWALRHRRRRHIEAITTAAAGPPAVTSPPAIPLVAKTDKQTSFEHYRHRRFVHYSSSRSSSFTAIDEEVIDSMLTEFQDEVSQ